MVVRVHCISLRNNSHSCCPQGTAVDKESYGSQNINELAFEDVVCYYRFFPYKFRYLTHIIRSMKNTHILV